MSTPQPIQFLLHQLATNEGDRERFNSIDTDVQIYQNFSTNYKTKFSFEADEATIFQALVDYKQEKIIRTCLSRVNGVDGNSVLNIFIDYKIQLNCYFDFDYELRNGKPLDTAIKALHDKMLELVPEYREFCREDDEMPNWDDIQGEDPIRAEFARLD